MQQAVNLIAIDLAFEEILYRRDAHRIVGRQRNSILQLRYRHKHMKNVSLNTKVFFLQKAKWPMDQYMYTRADLLALLKFYDKQSAAAKGMGHLYILDKWRGR